MPHGNQVQRFVIVRQAQCVFYFSVVKSADGTGSESHGGGGELNVLANVPQIHGDIAHRSIPVFGHASKHHGGPDNNDSGPAYDGLAQTGGSKIPIEVSVLQKLQRKIGYVEIPVRDMDASRKFFEELFSWRTAHDEEIDYVFFYTGEGIGGGFTLAEPAGSGPVVYIETADIDASLATVEKLGGFTELPKTYISQRHGYIARFRDIAGNLFGLWSSK